MFRPLPTSLNPISTTVCVCVCVYQHGPKPSKETYKIIPHNNSIDT